MADQNPEGQLDTDENLESSVSSTENPDEGQGDVSSASQSETDRRIAALEAKLQRESERNALLENSLKIQERFLQTRAEPAKPTADGNAWTQELDTLDKALDPVFQKRLKAAVEPIQQGYAAIIEDNDAMRFENFLSRNHPELLEDEDAYNRVAQQIQQVRDAARQRGMNITRVDAFVFNEGLQGTKQKMTERKKRKSTAVAEETKRAVAARTASATTSQGEPRAAGNAGIAAIRDKASRGERLTEAERTQYRNWVAGVEI